MIRPRLAVPAFALAAALAAALPVSASLDAAGRLLVGIDLRTGGADAVTVCQDGAFGAGVEAFADSVAAALGLPLTPATASAGSDCFSLHLNGPLTSRGPQGSRVLRFDGGALSSIASQAGYQEAFLIVCTPNVTDRVRVRTGPAPTQATGCESNGYVWPLLSPLDVEISYRATNADLAKGLLAAVSWWLALVTLLLLAIARVPGMRVIRRLPLLAVAAAALTAGAAAYGWSLVATRSPLLDSLEMLAGIGPGDAFTIRVVGSVLAVALIAATARRIARGDGRLVAPEPNGPVLGGVPALPLRDVVGPYAQQLHRAGPGLLWAFLPAVSLIVAYLLFSMTPAETEIKVEGMLATAVAYALLVPAMAGATLPAAYDARRLDAGAEAPILQALRECGSSAREVWHTPVPPAAAPIGGASVIAGRRVFVWDPLLALPASELAAGIALRGARRRSWITGFVGAVLVVVRYRFTSGGEVPLLVVAAPMLLLTGLGFLDWVERIRIRTAARNPSLIEPRLRGLFTVGRAHARLATGAALGIVAMPLPGYGQAHWERTLRLAHHLGLDAGLSTVDVARIADEAVADDAARGPIPLPAAPAPAPERIAPPETPAPAPAKKRAPAKKNAAPAKKKAAPAKKKTAVKSKAGAATRRAPAPRGRRPRP